MPCSRSESSANVSHLAEILSAIAFSSTMISRAAAAVSSSPARSAIRRRSS